MMTDAEYGATKLKIERENEEKLKHYPILEKQLDIAVKALRGVRVWANTGNGGEQAVKKLCDKALKEIEALNEISKQE